MAKHLYGKALVVCVILLFLGVGIQSSFAIVQREIMKTPSIEQDETWYLANFTFDVGDNLSNNRIDYERILKRAVGNWTINVKINFNCPDNLKIVVSYECFAEMEDTNVGGTITFCDVWEKVIIMNGSNPPDLNINYTQYCPHHGGNEWLLTLIIEAHLTAYKFINGEWELVHWDEIYNETQEGIVFNRVRNSERTHVLMRLFDRFPMLERLLGWVR
jgi:hypothetical protein